MKKLTGGLSHRGEAKLWEFAREGKWSAIVIQTRLKNRPLLQQKTDRILIMDTWEQLDSVTNLVNAIYDSKFSDAVFLDAELEKLQVIRGTFRMQGLFFGTIDNAMILTTEAKVLYQMGVEQIQRVEPGQKIEVTPERKATIETIRRFERPTAKPLLGSDRKLHEMRANLENSFARLRNEQVGVLFSGGVDSGLAALLASKVCSETTLFSVFGRDSHDESVSTQAAELLGLPYVPIQITPEDLWQNLPAVIYAIECSSRMDVTIALPFYLAACEASKKKVPIMISGQGPDELFAGYARHVQIFQDEGPRALENQLWKEVSRTHQVNLERDEKAIAAGGCETFFAYIYEPFVYSALTIPADWKIRMTNGIQRKFIFRLLARDIGLPEKIVWEPKSATQFSSATDRLLIKAIQQFQGTKVSLTKREAQNLVQKVLDKIAIEVGIPIRGTTSDFEGVDTEQIVDLVDLWRSKQK